MRLRHSLFLVPGLLLVGCGDNIQPETDDSAPIEAEGETPGPEIVPEEPTPNEREIAIDFYSQSTSRDAVSAQLEAGVRYADDNTPILDATCRFTFADGSSQDGCVIDHVFPAAGEHTVSLEVRIPGTDRVIRQDVLAFAGEAFELGLEVTVPACGLEISYLATQNRGGEGGVWITGPGAVVSSDPDWVRNRTGTVGVTEPGTYTVSFEAENESTGPLCSREIVREVTVIECHDHTPSCGH